MVPRDHLRVGREFPPFLRTSIRLALSIPADAPRAGGEPNPASSSSSLSSLFAIAPFFSFFLSVEHRGLLFFPEAV